MKDFSAEELLGRQPVHVDMEEILPYLRGKIVLVTGGGGSIGSEICRQVACCSPKHLLIFDIYENNAYELQLELKHKHVDLNLTVLIGSVQDERRVNEIFSQYKPEIVFHAAAHKHVPLMEANPCEAIKNNVAGTYITATAAIAYGSERFVLISTDKAVKPTNIMGASKQICELLLRVLSEKHSRTKFVTVRFGNVFGSNGSVIPIFRKQIENGGPVLVTHPEVERYFMTIEEAVSLVLLAGASAEGGEVYVLDMGLPVRIDDLARKMIRYYGLEPDRDIKIEYVGLRPGEKLYEEPLVPEVGFEKTAHDRIYVSHPKTLEADGFLRNLDDLILAAYENRSDIRELVRKIVPDYVTQ